MLGCADNTVRILAAPGAGPAPTTTVEPTTTITPTTTAPYAAPILGDDVLEQGGQQLLRLEGHEGWVNAVAVSADGAYVVSGSADSTVRIWDMSSGYELQRLDGHTDQVYTVAVSGNFAARPFVVSGSYDTTAKIWDARSWTEKYSFPHPNKVRSVSVPRIRCGEPWNDAFPCLGLASATADGVRIWDPKTGMQQLHLDGFEDIVDAVAFHPYGYEILTGSRDSTAAAWDIFTKQYCEDPELGGWMLPDDPYCSDAGIRMSSWDQGEHGDRLRSVAIWASTRTYYYYTPPPYYMYYGGGMYGGYSGGGMYGGYSGGGMYGYYGGGMYGGYYGGFRRLRGYNHVDDNKPPTIAGAYGTNSSSSSSRSLYMYYGPSFGYYYYFDRTEFYVTASDDRKVRIWRHCIYEYSCPYGPDDYRCCPPHQWEPGVPYHFPLFEAKRFEGHTGDIYSVAISVDGKYVVSGSGDGTARVWERSTGAEVEKFEPGAAVRSHDYFTIPRNSHAKSIC